MGTGYPQSNSMDTLCDSSYSRDISEWEKQVYKLEWRVAMRRTYSEDTSSGCRNDEVEASSNAPPTKPQAYRYTTTHLACSWWLTTIIRIIRLERACQYLCRFYPTSRRHEAFSNRTEKPNAPTKPRVILADDCGLKRFRRAVFSEAFSNTWGTWNRKAYVPTKPRVILAYDCGLKVFRIVRMNRFRNGLIMCASQDKDFCTKES
jgi:hypothetical protein